MFFVSISFIAINGNYIHNVDVEVDCEVNTPHDRMITFSSQKQRQLVM